jgi:hypothetical protein
MKGIRICQRDNTSDGTHVGIRNLAGIRRRTDSRTSPAYGAIQVRLNLLLRSKFDATYPMPPHCPQWAAVPPTGVPVEPVLVEVVVPDRVVVLLLVPVDPVIPKNARSIVSCTGTVCPTPFPIF